MIDVPIGCSSGETSHGPSGGEGTVTGKLQAVGGPPVVGGGCGSPLPLLGTISLRATNGAGRVYSATAGPDGRFSVRVPVGSYTVTGRSQLFQRGQLDCQASGPVTVSAGATTEVVVSCHRR